MPHYFVNPKNIINNKFTIEGDEFHHLVNVRRISKNEVINIFDGKGNSYTGSIVEIGISEIKGIITQKNSPAETVLNVVLYNSVPKGSRFDWLIEKSAELGVKEIVPLISERSSIHEVSLSKIERWKRLSLSACSQCGRSDLLKIGKPLSFTEALKSISKEHLNLVAWEGEEAMGFENALLKNTGTERINIFIGPEGGFVYKEIEQAKSAGIISVSLGRRILRVETAGILCVILALNGFGEYNS